MQRALAVAIAVLLVAGMVGLGTHREQGPPPDPAVATEALVAELKDFVERTRGLRFKGPVPVELLDDRAFEARLLGEAAQDRAELDKATKVLRALDLIPAGVDLGEAQRALLSQAVAGFYDVKKKQLVVRGAKPTPAVRQVLVHELTHALQDQHFDLHRPEVDDADDERGDGFSGLVEGDAVRVDAAYLASLPRSQRAKAEDEQAEQGAGIGKGVPEVLLEALGFPYAVGPRFVAHLVEVGGQPRLDAAFAQPPTTSEQLMHPEKYVAGEAGAPVPEPPADGPVIDRGVFGEFGFVLQLQRAAGLPRQRVLEAAAGWGGDRYVAWEAGAQACVRVDVVMDSGRDADELAGALRAWARDRRGARVEGTSPVRFTSCG